LCCLFERYKRVFGTFFSLLEMQEKACPSLASDNRVYILGYLERTRNSDDIALFQFLSRPLSRQLAILFMQTVPIGYEYAPPSQCLLASDDGFIIVAIKKEREILVILSCSNFSRVHCRVNAQYYFCFSVPVGASLVLHRCVLVHHNISLLLKSRRATVVSHYLNYFKMFCEGFKPKTQKSMKRKRF